MLGRDWLSTSSPLGVFDAKNQSWKAFGAGVFIYDKPFIWYVTANHIIKNLENSIYVLINHMETGKSLIDLKSLQKQHEIEWLIDENYDLAATLFPTNKNFKIKAVNFSYFIHSKDMLPSMRCYSSGCPYSLVGFDVEKVQSYILEGIISRIDENQNRIYVTVPTFPGNSGGPLFVCNEPFKANGNLAVGAPMVYFGGIISEYVLIRDGNENAIPPMHLGVVIPSEAIQNLLATQKAQQAKRNIEKK